MVERAAEQHPGQDGRSDLHHRAAAAAAAARGAAGEVAVEVFGAALLRLPPLTGRRIRVRFLADPRTHRGRMFSGGYHGVQVHAGSHLRRREMAVDLDLLDQPRELTRILFHELFHFAWVRLGNQERRAWERILAAECRSGSRGELGWSAELRKAQLTPGDVTHRTRRWREYACESFCDTAAWMCAGLKRHGEYTLAGAWRRSRREYFQVLLARPALAI